nr:MAG TPA: zinc-ribbon containing domain protein [Caudoviricetes sp.]
MKQISKVFIVVGLGIMFIGGMLDADGENYILLLIAMALGAVVALVGVAIMDVENRREEKRKAYFYMIRRKDKFDADVEFLGEFEEVAK